MKDKKRYHLLHDYHLLAYDSLDSTNEEAKRLAEGGAVHGAVIWAKQQTAGRGRIGRQWQSDSGNLFVSLLLSPECDLATASQLSFVSAIAAVEALRPLLLNRKQVTCKWPNDILLDGKKAGGILLESFSTETQSGKRKQWVVVGVGINIDSYPKDAMFPASSLREAGVELVSAKIVLIRFLGHFMHHYDDWVQHGFTPIRENWLEYAYGKRRNWSVRVGEQVISGKFAGLSETGELQLKDKNNTLNTINSGDVFFDRLKPITTRND